MPNREVSAKQSFNVDRNALARQMEAQNDREINVRRADLTDHTTIVKFNQNMARETEDKQLPAEVISAGVEKVLRDANSERGFYVVAEDARSKTVVGCLLITFEWSDWRDGWFWWIQSVYVSQEARGRGVYRRLYEWVKMEAQNKGDVRGIRLYVEKENAVAQTVYERLGMSETVYKMYETIF